MNGHTSDTISEPDSDVTTVGTGSDTITEPDSDVMTVGTGSDTITEPDSDVMTVGTGSDTITEPDSDVMTVGTGSDAMDTPSPESITTFPEIYNNLSELEDAARRINNCPQIHFLLALLLSIYDLHRHYDIRLVYKRFEIAADETVVSFGGGNFKLTVIAKEDGTLPLKTLSLHGLEPPATNGHLVPTDFLIDHKEGRAIPYEFDYLGEDHHQPHTFDETFLRHWCTALRIHNLSGLLGLAVRNPKYPLDFYDALISEDNNDDDDDEGHTPFVFQSPTPVVDLTKHTPTAWRVSKAPGRLTVAQCRYSRMD